jgi:hypothetical protein
MCTIHAKGEFYQGEWLAGKRNGKGRQTYGGRPVRAHHSRVAGLGSPPVSSGSSLTSGVWACVQPDGFGGDIYEGDWADNQVGTIPSQALAPSSAGWTLRCWHIEITAGELWCVGCSGTARAR